ncbi:MAG: hypothetical protein ACKODH_11875 [Limisphaerales bacterium]
MKSEIVLVSRAFRIGPDARENRAGLVVASAEAFFLVVGPTATQMGMALSGGALGGVLAAYLAKNSAGKPLSDEVSGVIETDLAELPAAVTTHADWPVRQQSGPVIVIPREAIQCARYSFWKWGIFLPTANVEFRIEPPFFGRERLFQQLASLGWKIEGV